MTTESVVLRAKKEIAVNVTELTLGFSAESKFHFLPGQFIELHYQGDRREFSIASAPNQAGEIKIAFRDSPSAFKQSLLAASLGTELLVQGPFGAFTLPAETQSAAFLAGGIGITPFKATIESRPAARLGLLYANHSPERAAYLDELRAWSGDDRLKLHEHYGRLDEAAVAAFVAATAAELYFIAGPLGFCNAALEQLMAAGVARGQILLEQFTGYD